MEVSFSIRLTDTERALAESYAKLHALSLAEAFKRALFEKIEDEYDIALADEAYEEYLRSGKQARPIEDLWKELDLEDDVYGADDRRLRSGFQEA